MAFRLTAMLTQAEITHIKKLSDKIAVETAKRAGGVARLRRLGVSATVVNQRVRDAKNRLTDYLNRLR